MIELAIGCAVMKRFFILITAGLVLLSTASYGAETAQARLVCISLRFAEGTTYGGTLDLSTIGGPPYNGELMLSGYTWTSGFALYYGGLGSIYGTIYVNLPPFADANNDGINDFFEVSQGVATTVTSGYYTTDISVGTVSATWSRAAGSKSGTCSFDLVDDTYGDLGTYTCPFEVIEYTGPLTYTPGSNTVSASINQTQTGNPANTFQGPIAFDKSTTDRFNTLTNRPGTWTNAALQMLTFDNEVFTRDPLWHNYAGYVYFADGDPNTAAPDYQSWALLIDDTNDVNANGIPDFSDVPMVTLPPRAPRLSLAPGATNLWLTISGDVGHTNDIQELDSVTATNWQTTLSLTLTNDPQVVSLSLPSVRMKFWRVLAR
jgi:hypothetical protein